LRVHRRHGAGADAKIRAGYEAIGESIDFLRETGAGGTKQKDEGERLITHATAEEEGMLGIYPRGSAEH
jgi:hypothetical protein